MSTTRLTEDDIEKLFSGAPQYYARNEGPFISTPHPSITFPFDEGLPIRDLSDHVQIEAKAWSCVTTRPHISHDARSIASPRRQSEVKKTSHFHVRCYERPNMLSLSGLEKGTMGFQAALELAVSDSLEEEQFGFDSIGKKAKAIIDAREAMLSNDGWLHRITENDLMDRLNRNGDIHRNNNLKGQSSTETYNDLFRNFMRPRYIAVDKTDNHSLTNQIVALLKCLGSPNVWIDLSHVEWRVRLGQILWGEHNGDQLNDDANIQDTNVESERAEERYWLLLQILVSTELLLRLDAITEGEEYGAGGFRPIDIVQFERAANVSVKWSLILARSWLENINVSKESPEAAPAFADCQQRRGSEALAAIASKFSFHHPCPDNRPPSPPYQYIIQGRFADRQVDGLLHFAKTLSWPNYDEFEARITDRIRHVLEPPVPKLQRNKSNTSEASNGGYFGTWDVTCQRGHHKERSQARRRKVAAALNPSGWLSKSYIFGLMLPGDGLSHFLMATLLENDDAALQSIGSFANLCGGFIYSGMSFWSTACIVGRVLAAGKGTAECMGWISTDIIPEDMGDGWVNIDVHDVAGKCARETRHTTQANDTIDDLTKLGKRSRLWAKKKLEQESSIIGDSVEETIAAADFIVPHENMYTTMPPGTFILMHTLKLCSASQSLHPTPLTEIIPTPSHEVFPDAPDLPSYPATITFTVAIDGEPEKKHSMSLFYDVNFVTAHPCAPSHRVRFLKSPSSPTIQEIDASGLGKLGQGSRSVYRAGKSTPFGHPHPC